MKRSKTSIYHWRFETGEQEFVGASKVYPSGYRPGAPRGWYCWVYAEDDDEFEKWMRLNCPSADCTRRFNSGDPMTTVYIPDDNEAMLFKLRWI